MEELQSIIYECIEPSNPFIKKLNLPTANACLRVVFLGWVLLL